MRTFFLIIAIFSLTSLAAQSQATSYGREPSRCEIISYPTAQLATLPASEPNRFRTQLSDWTQQGDSFTANFTYPFAWANRQLLFGLEWASVDYELIVNSRTVAYNGDANNPTEFNITRYCQEGQNTIQVRLKSPSEVVKLESWRQNSAPKIGSAWVMSQPTMRIRDILTRTWKSDSTYLAEVGIVVKSDALNPRTSRIHFELLAPNGRIVTGGFKDLTLKMRGEDTLRVLSSIEPNLLWSTTLPTQYTLRLRTQFEGRNAEFMEYKFGFRALDFRDGKLSLNGSEVALHAKIVDPSISESEIALLRENGYNTLQLLPGIVRAGLYDDCDRLGVFVIPQAPIDTSLSGNSRRKDGNPSNNPAWLNSFLERTQASYHTSKRHPSVIAFSLARESSNGICLYESYLNMKQFGDIRPFIYPGAGGEWNSDRLDISTTPGVRY